MDLALIGALAVLGGLGVFSIFYAVAVPRLHFRRAQSATFLDGIQVNLDQADMGITAPEFGTRGLLLGAILGLLASLAVGVPTPFLPFIAGGYIVLWTQLEDKRNQRINAYHHDLATAMGIIVNSWKVTPSLSRALEAVIMFGPGGGDGPNGGPAVDSVADDFNELLRALRAGTPIREALQALTDRRRSPIFDGLATALLVAEEQGSQAGPMLERQMHITHQQVEVFNEAIGRQKTARNEVRNGTVGPWAILLMMQVMSLIGVAGVDTTFFKTFTGTVVVLVAAVATVGMYAGAMRIAGRGLILGRVPTEHGRAT